MLGFCWAGTDVPAVPTYLPSTDISSCCAASDEARSLRHSRCILSLFERCTVRRMEVQRRVSIVLGQAWSSLACVTVSTVRGTEHRVGTWHVRCVCVSGRCVYVHTRACVRVTRGTAHGVAAVRLWDGGYGWREWGGEGGWEVMRRKGGGCRRYGLKH